MSKRKSIINNNALLAHIIYNVHGHLRGSIDVTNGGRPAMTVDYKTMTSSERMM